MKPIFNVILLVMFSPGLCGIAIAANNNSNNGLKHQVEELQAQVEELQAQVESLQEQDIAVDCSAGETVTDALASIANSSAPAVIEISGTCNESVTIDRNAITLKGSGAADGFQGVPGEITVYVVGANQVRVESMTIIGGSSGIECVQGANAVIKDVIVTGSGGVLTAAGGLCILEDTTIENGTGSGVISAVNGAVYITGNSIIQNNPGSGVDALAGGSVLLLPGPGGGQPIIRNNGTGISIQANSTLFPQAGIIELNTGRGVQLDRGGSMFSTNLTVQNNGGDGVSISALSNAFLLPGNTITGNDGFGLNCSGTVALVNIAATITGNGLGDISPDCP